MHLFSGSNGAECGSIFCRPLLTLQANEISPDEVRELAEHFETQPLTEILRWAWERFGKRAGIGTSFQGAGLVMIHHALKAVLEFPVFTLDTNLLFPETYELKSRLENYWGIQIEGVQPELTLEKQSAEYHPELWKRSEEHTSELQSPCNL